MYASMEACAHVYRHRSACTHTYMRTYVHAYIFKVVQMYIHMCSYTFVYIYTHIYNMCTHTQVLLSIQLVESLPPLLRVGVQFSTKLHALWLYYWNVLDLGIVLGYAEYSDNTQLVPLDLGSRFRRMCTTPDKMQRRIGPPTPLAKPALNP